MHASCCWVRLDGAEDKGSESYKQLTRKSVREPASLVATEWVSEPPVLDLRLLIVCWRNGFLEGVRLRAGMWKDVVRNVVEEGAEFSSARASVALQLNLF